jgi:phytoene synthase
LLEGLRSDIGSVRIRTTGELVTYAHRVAGVVGLMLCHVFGVRDRRALENADQLGIAMQLTNVCRDVVEDWGRDRVYVPAEMLVEPGSAVSAAGQALTRHSPSSVARAVQGLLRLADRYYAGGDAGLYALPFRVALAVRTARLVYAAIGRELERRGCDVWSGRAVVPTWKKLALAGQAVVQEILQRGRTLLFRKRGAPLSGVIDGS